MCWLGILGVFIVLYKSTQAEIYNISNYPTEWRNAICTKAEPILSYNNYVFEVNETIGKLPTSDVWIGYLTAKVPFYFHGCADFQNEPTYSVTSIGYCKSVCVNSTQFGVQASQRQDLFNATVVMNCRCVNIDIDDIAVGNCGDNRCNKDCYAIFSLFTDSVNQIETERESDCLTYYYPGFQWQACTRVDPIKSLCSSRMSADPSPITITNQRTHKWIEGNMLCLNDDTYPATVASITSTTFNIEERQQYYWTGIVRANTLMKGDSIGKRLLYNCFKQSKLDKVLMKNKLKTYDSHTHTTSKSTTSTRTYVDSTYLSEVLYGFLLGNTGKVHFTRNGKKQALCASEGPIDVTTLKDPTTFSDATKSSERPAIRDDTPDGSRKSLAIGVGIGVSLGVLVVAAVIILFRRRKKCQRCSSHKSSAIMIDNIGCEAKHLLTAKQSVSDHNCHVQGNTCISETEHLDHNSTANDQNEAIVDAVIYHTINDAVEPPGNVAGDSTDYDYTTSKVVKIKRDTDKVYNKLKFKRHGEYNHVKGHRQMHDLPASNHYDTASVSVKEHTTLASVTDDYDHVEGKGRIHIAATRNDYDMTDSAITVRAVSASAKDDEGEYNHISNLPCPTHEESKDITA